ncbi:MAG: LPXTG cell wall anchor domain-containing protein [Rubrobacteraceae bacterium]
MKRLLLLAFVAMMALALVAPAAFAGDYDDDDGFDDDDNGVPAQVAPLPDTGGPGLLLPVAGAALLGAGAVGVGLVRRRR